MYKRQINVLSKESVCLAIFQLRPQFLDTSDETRSFCEDCIIYASEEGDKYPTLSEVNSIYQLYCIERNKVAQPRGILIQAILDEYPSVGIIREQSKSYWEGLTLSEAGIELLNKLNNPTTVSN